MCPTCGSFLECPHDRETDGNDEARNSDDDEGQNTEATKLMDPASTSRSDVHMTNRLIGPSGPSNSTSSSSSPSLAAADIIDTCDMVTNAPIAGDCEVFNTYGEILTNAQLLARYGFTLDSNDNDVIAWDLEDLMITFFADYVKGRERRTSETHIFTVVRDEGRRGEDPSPCRRCALGELESCIQQLREEVSIARFSFLFSFPYIRILLLNCIVNGDLWRGGVRPFYVYLSVIYIAWGSVRSIYSKRIIRRSNPQVWSYSECVSDPQIWSGSRLVYVAGAGAGDDDGEERMIDGGYVVHML